MIRDLFNRIKVVDQCEEPQVQTNSDTDIVSQIIDTLGYESCMFAILLGTLTDANVVVSVKLEEGDNSGLSDATVVAAKDIQLDARMIATPEATFQAAFDFSADLKSFKVGYKGGKRYLRLTLSPVANDAGSIPVAVACLLGNARHGENVNTATQTP
jgi:hypothetical protein